MNKKQITILIFLYFSSLILTILGIVVWFNASASDHEHVGVSIIALGITVFVCATNTVISFQNNNSNTIRDRDNLIMSVINQNFNLFHDKYSKIEELSNNVKKNCSTKEYLKIYLFKLNLEKTEHFNDPEKKQLRVSLGTQPLKTNSFQKNLKDFVLDNKKTNLDPIIFTFLKNYDRNVYDNIPIEDNIKKTIENAGKDQNDAIIKLISECPAIFSKLDNIYKTTSEIHEFKYNDVFRIINSIFEKSYTETGHFFRHTHRIIKMINEIKNDKVKKNFLGILRAQYSENIILAIYFNSVFTEKGIGLGFQLINSDFFVDKNDIDSDNLNIHANFKNLYFKDKHKQIIKSFFVKRDQNNINKLELKEFKNSLEKTFNS